MALSLSVASSVPSSLSGTRELRITELKRIGTSLQPTGTEFRWSAQNRAMNRGPWTYALQLRTSRQDLPGAEEPSEQVLGWNYTPFNMTGVWDDRYNGATLNKDGSVSGAGYAERTRREFEEMVKRGNLVQILSEEIAIVGLITNLQISYRRKEYIGWQFTFSPHFRHVGETVRDEANPTRKITSDPKTSVAKARAALDALQAAQDLARAKNLSKVQQLLKTGIFSTINGYLDSLETNMKAIENTVENEILVAQNAANALNRAAQLLGSVKTDVSNILAAMTHVALTSDMAVTSAVETLQFESWRRETCAAARYLMNSADDSRKDVALRAQPKPKRLHRVRGGESLYQISTRYFGTPFHWQDILKANGLTSIILTGGELLVIPELGV